MKSKIFIGSSVEGLSVAYAIQQNLTHDAESTVWDQGVFDLSKTTIEALDEILQTMDFGIFVFSSDDVTILRGNESMSVRDNVLFELGLFIGKLGRNRVFFVMPDNSEVYIPTDLLGVNPGKFDPNREDGSLQAATGALCNQIRNQIKKLGFLRKVNELEEAGKSTSEKAPLKNEWFQYFLNNDFQTAKDKLEKSIQEKTGDDVLEENVWLAYVKLKMSDKSGIDELCNLAKNNHENFKIFKLATQFLSSEDYDDLAIELTEAALAKSNKDIDLNIILASYYAGNLDNEKAIEILNSCSPTKNPKVALALASKYEDSNEILKILSTAYKNSPNDQELVYEFAQKLEKNDHFKEALYLYDFLTFKYPDEVQYWGYLSNACLRLDLYDKAMATCRKAEELSERKEAWILMNIGNMLNNKGFHTEAISWLNEGLELDSESQYAHDRIAGAIKNKEDDNKKYVKLKKEGRTLLKQANFEIDKT